MNLGVLIALGTLMPFLGLGMPSFDLSSQGSTLTSSAPPGHSPSKFISLQFWVTDEFGNEIANSEKRGVDYTLCLASNSLLTAKDEDPLSTLGRIHSRQWLAHWQFPVALDRGAAGQFVFIEGRSVVFSGKEPKEPFGVTYGHAKRASGTVEVP